MFTGIVQGLGRIGRVRSTDRDRDLVVDCPAEILQRLSPGASVAIDGVCQTVTRLDPASFTVHAIEETLRVTTLGRLEPGAPVNLEAALGAGDPLGGHFVQGHVDGTARLRARTGRGESVAFEFESDPELVGQLVPKGSIALDGVSLTVGPEITANRFTVYLIPHTLELTTLGARQPGDLVNVETDILGKYILRFLGGREQAAGLSWESLREAGYGAPDPGGRG